MFGIRDLVLACLVVAAAVGGSAGWLGYSTGRGAERGQWLELERQRGETAAETARIAAAADTRIGAAAEQKHVRVVARAQGVKREVVYLPRPDCEWADDERMRLESLHAVYFGDGDAAGGLPGGLRSTAGAAGAADGLGRADAGLGLRMPEEAK